MHTVETAASSSKALQIPPKCYIFFGNEKFQLHMLQGKVKLQLPAPMLKVARKVGEKNRSKGKSQNGKKNGPLFNFYTGLFHVGTGATSPLPFPPQNGLG